LNILRSFHPPLPPSPQVFTSSDAVLEIADRLKEPFPQLARLAKVLLPHVFRDALYSFVSSNRHLLAGEKDSCRIPSENEMERFLDQ
jgi:predicted DCC family thiol-disulfide oxidoreductase YuxK